MLQETTIQQTLVNSVTPSPTNGNTNLVSLYNRFITLAIFQIWHRPCEIAMTFYLHIDFVHSHTKCSLIQYLLSNIRHPDSGSYCKLILKY